MNKKLSPCDISDNPGLLVIRLLSLKQEFLVKFRIKIQLDPELRPERGFYSMVAIFFKVMTKKWGKTAVLCFM